MTPTCINCNYDLTGLDPNGFCPECGTPVQSSLLPAPRPLVLAGAPHINKLKRGLTITLIGAAMTYSGWSVYAIGITLWLLDLRHIFNLRAATPIKSIAIPSIPLGAIIACIGIYLFTAPRPDLPKSTTTDARRMSRSCAVALAACTLVALSSISSQHGLARILPILALMFPLSGLAALTLHTALFVSLITYTKEIAQAINAKRLEKITTTYTWLIPAFATIGLVLLALGPIIAALLQLHLLLSTRRALANLERKSQT